MRALLAADRRALSSPNRRLDPDVGNAKPSSRSINEDLPAPFLPSSPTTWPCPTARSTSRRISRPPTTLVRPCAQRIDSFIALLLPAAFHQNFQILGRQLQLPRREHQLLYLRLHL